MKNLTRTPKEQWLAWIWQALELDEFAQSGLLKFDETVQIQVTVDRERQGLWSPSSTPAATEPAEGEAVDLSRPFAELFPLLKEVPPEPGQVLRRLSVTQLINFQRCARQYYFDRTLKTPGKEERAVWNDAEAPEPPANLTATLKGAVIHRFCETFIDGDDAETRLRTSFDDIVAQRQAELAGRAFEIDPTEALRDLMPLAQNYLKSEVFQRVSHASRVNAEVSQTAIRHPQTEPGLWSELRFRLRRPLGMLTGTIDKLLITPSVDGEGFDVEIIDFKTNRFRTPSHPAPRQPQTAAAAATLLPAAKPISKPRGEIRSQPAQALFNFDTVVEESSANLVTTAELPSSEPESSIAEQAEKVARDYQLQMQSYALALRELLGVRTGSGSDRVMESSDFGTVPGVR